MSTYETVRARPISFADIAALAHRAAEPVEVYRAKVTGQHGLTLTPVTLTPEPVSSKALAGEDFPHHVMFLAVRDDGPSAMGAYTVDRSQPVGYAVDFTAVSMFGARFRVSLFTSEEAERTAELVRKVKEPARVRQGIYVNDALAGEMRLTPVYGSRLSVGVVVKGLGPEEVAQRAEAALRAEFGDAMGSVRSVMSRAAEDLRVNVYTSSAKDEVLATNVLASEVGFVSMDKPYTEEAAATVQPVEIS